MAVSFLPADIPHSDHGAYHMKALITGISGSGGSYLAEYLVENNLADVHGISRWHSTSTNHNLKRIADKVTVHECDLTDFGSTLNAVYTAHPDVVFHLASHANVRASFTNPVSVIQNNVIGTVNLFEALRRYSSDVKVVHCSTSEVYGQVLPEEVPIRETAPIRASSPYAVSKVAQDLLAYTYFKSYGMKIIRTRMFTYLNPRRKDLFATSFASQVARIEQGKQKTLTHGNLDSLRTIIDVRDAVAAYWEAALKGVPGEGYNIGGNFTVSVGEFLEELKSLAKCEIVSGVDESLLRPSDVTLQIPDCTKFTELTGWKPKYPFKESVQFLLDECREYERWRQ